ncbi:gliding motility-associated C-terminal domain-containing protein [Flavobacterium sp. ASW18X]|uniref:T9SS type B sorting domain-containing protein n=1 Tax=Flavobacterium sp. ASW18X TaxID=2572595 RepID=UPI0010AE604C|nr:gliding motility-associated C-terminal domain-containing protein [Flavobacterium sp. ASW18X]TKD61010.1 T9SS type B sorting domain-containing protein [Flavobacterium sp. ASW18X]
MFKKLLFNFLFFIAYFAHAADIFVDQSAPIGGDGSSWALAFQTIEEAVASAASGDTIFIAEGIYKPQSEIDITVPLTIRGGYVEGGGARDLTSHVTQIQADFDPNNLLLRIFDIGINAASTFEGIRIYNSRYAISTRSNLIVDQVEFEAFAIYGVKIDGDVTNCTINNSIFSNHVGSAIHSIGETVNTISISNSIFQNGSARSLYVDDNTENFLLTDCIFKEYNSTSTIVSIDSPNVIINSTIFKKNTSSAVLSINGSNVLFDDILVEENSCQSRIIYQGDGITSIRNSLFNNNFGTGACIQTTNGCDLFLENVDFIANDISGTASVLHGDSADVNTSNCRFLDNISSGSSNAIVDLRGDNGANILFDACLFKNNISQGTTCLEIEYDADLTVNNCVFENNGSTNSSDLDLWNLDSATITNNTFINNSSTKPVLDIGIMSVSPAIVDGNIFMNNNGREINVDRVDNISLSNNRYYGENVLLAFDRTPMATMTNEFIEGNSSGSRFMILDETNLTINNLAMISAMQNGNHRLINSSGDTSLNIINSTFSAIDFNNTNVSVGFSADLPSRVRNTIIWSGSDLSQSGFHGNTSNLQVRHSLIKSENPSGAGNLNGNLITNAPIFLNPENGDFREQRCSPTVNAGNNAYTTETLDLRARPRVYQSVVDMGAYEAQANKNNTCTTPALPDCASLTFPGNGQNNVAVSTNFNWPDASRADGYRISAGTASGGNDLIDNVTVFSSDYNVPFDFEEGQTIYVNITSFNESGETIGCIETSFTTASTISGGTLPNCSNLLIPVDGATEVEIDADISWNAVSGANGYLISVGSTPGGIDIRDNYDVGNVTVYDFPLDLPGSSEIFVIIIPYNDEGQAMGCVEESFFTTTAPTAPACTNLNTPLNGATGVSNSTDLSWNAIANANGYYLTVGTTAGGNDILDAEDVTGTTFDLPADLPENTQIFVTLVPYNGVGNATGCTEESFTTETLPTVPSCTNLSIPLNGATDVSIATDLSWNPIANADGYYLTVGTTIGGNDILDAEDVTGTTFDLPADLPENTQIFVTLVPYNGVGNATGCTEESFTTETVATVPSCTSLSAPLNASVGVSISTDLSWNAVANADGYYVTVGTTTGGNDILNAEDVAGTTFDLPADLPENTQIFVTIIPYNAVGDATGCTEESFTTETVATVPSCTNLSIPLNGATDVSISTDLSWNAIANADGYYVTVGTTTGGNDILDAEDVTGTTFDLPADLPENTQIFVTLVPYNGVGNATGCTEESFITETVATLPSCTSLSAPLNAATGVSISTDLSWNPIANANGYYLTVGTTTGGNDILDAEDVTDTTFDLPTDLPENTQIFVTIVPYNAVGDATGCTEESFTTETVATVPNCTSLSAPLNASVGVSISTDLSWNAVANADGYYLTVGTTTGGNDILDAENVTGTTFDLPTDLPENTQIFVTVVPYNGVGNATGCTEESFTTETVATVPNCTSLSAPLNAATSVSISTDLNWNAVANADGYYLTVGTTAGGDEIVPRTDLGILTNYSFTEDLPYGQELFVTITPYNALGDAENCSIESFVTEEEPEQEKVASKYGFSPDGDGVNEFWEINGIEAYPENTVYIYNRWGDLVFKIEGYNNADNVFKGQVNQLMGLGADQLPEGTYFFTIILPENHNLQTTKGFVVLKR